jgi:hypothetical protein
MATGVRSAGGYQELFMGYAGQQLASIHGLAMDLSWTFHGLFMDLDRFAWPESGIIYCPIINIVIT